MHRKENGSSFWHLRSYLLWRGSSGKIMLICYLLPDFGDFYFLGSLMTSVAEITLTGYTSRPIGAVLQHHCCKQRSEIRLLLILDSYIVAEYVVSWEGFFVLFIFFTTHNCILISYCFSLILGLQQHMIICRVYSIPQVSTLYLHPSFSDVTNNASHNFCEAILIHAIFKQTRRSQYASGKHKEQRISGIPCSTVGNYFMTMGGS